MLLYFILFCFILFYFILCILYCIMFYYIISYHIILYCIISYHIISYHIVLYYIIYCIILYYIILYYIILYDLISHYMTLCFVYIMVIRCNMASPGLGFSISPASARGSTGEVPQKPAASNGGSPGCTSPSTSQSKDSESPSKWISVEMI